MRSSRPLRERSLVHDERLVTARRSPRPLLASWLRINRVARRSHANRLHLTAGGRASSVRQALTTPVQKRSRLLDAPSTGEQSRERGITQPDARLDERDGAGDRIPNSV